MSPRGRRRKSSRSRKGSDQEILSQDPKCALDRSQEYDGWTRPSPKRPRRFPDSGVGVYSAGAGGGETRDPSKCSC